MRQSSFFWVILALMILMDFYVFGAIKALSSGASPRNRSLITIIYWSLSIGALLLFLLLPYLNLDSYASGLRSTVFAILIGLFFAKFITAAILLVDDLRRGLQWIAVKLFSNKEGERLSEGEGISRSNFLSWLALAAGTGLFGTLLYGFSNKYNYKVKRVKLRFPNLPAAFNGLKVVQLSDIHSGSFTDKAAVQRGVDLVMQQGADLILFTGDLVNNKAEEMKDFTDLFGQLKAPMGVFSVLGNHDYGDYVAWENGEAKKRNLTDLQNVHKSMGWRLLLNEHAVLEKEGEKIGLLGIENWSSKARFPKYGKMEEAHRGTEDLPFKILMSHDPSHWDAQVRTTYKDIDLMLSGHTHGMQFGVELPWLKWSPVQYVYTQWAGLYESQKQKLYVNRGFGFIGYPGRVGVLPEITVLELSA